MRLATTTDLLALEDLASSQAVALRLRIGKRVSHRDVTFEELRTLIARSAGSLLSQGCRHGDRVALLMPHSLSLVTTFFGCLYAGLVPAVVAWPTAKMDAEKYRRNVTTVVGSLEATFLVTDQGSAERLGDHVGNARVIDPDQIAGDEMVEASPRRTGPLFIQFSGGTTGSQKSVPVDAIRLEAQLTSYAKSIALTREDRLISWLPLYHDMGLVACLLLPFMYRLPVSMFAPMEWVMDPRPFLEHIGPDRSTLTWLPNFAFPFMATRVSNPSEAIDLSSLRAAINCSEPVRAESVDLFQRTFAQRGLRRAALSSCYAMAEATFAVTQTCAGQEPLRLRVSRGPLGLGQIRPSTEPDARVLVSSGQPIEGSDIVVVDDAGLPVGPERVGEIWVRAPFVMEDYLPSPDRPRRASFDGEWYKTGDLGVLRQGELFVTGRLKDIIIVGGVNVFPEDVEAAIYSVPGVHAGRAVAMGLPDAQLGTERLVIVAELDHEDNLASAEAIEAAARAAIMADCGVTPAAVFLVPPRWIVKSTAGKTSRIETKARLLRNWSELNRDGRARFEPQTDPE